MFSGQAQGAESQSASFRSEDLGECGPGGKRWRAPEVKSPKIYSRDTGLLHALLQLSGPDDLLNQSWVGASFENYVIDQILDHLSARGVDAQPSFLRTSDGHEIDLVLDLPGQRWAIEIKLTTHPSPQDLTKLGAYAEWIGATKRALVSRTAEVLESATTLSCNVEELLQRIA